MQFLLDRFNLRSDFGDAKGFLGSLSFILLFGCLASVHLYVRFQGLTYAGPLLVLNHVFDLTLVLTIFAICAGIGIFILTWCGCRFDHPLETLLFASATGGGLLSTSILICGLLSGLHVLVLAGLLVLYAFLARKELCELPGLVAESFAYLRANSHILSLSIFGALVFFMVLQALTPPLDWDSLTYHLRVPAQFLQKGQIYLPEDNMHTAFVQLVQMLYIPLLAFGSPSGPALISTYYALLLGLAVFAFCLRFLNGRAASLSLPLLWGSPMLLLVAMTPRVDVTLAFYLFLAHYALCRALLTSSIQPFFFLAAVLLGFAFGVKYHALAYMLALSPFIVWAAYTYSHSLTASLRSLLAFGLLIVGVALPWLVKNWLLFRAPFYPFFAESKPDLWLMPFYADQGSLPLIEVYPQLRVMFNLHDLFLAPGRLTIEPEGPLYLVNFLFLLLPLGIFFWKQKILNCLLLPALCYAIIVVTVSPYTNLRYLIPAMVPLTIVVVHITERFCARFFPLSGSFLLFVPLTLLTMAPTGMIIFLWLSKTMSLHYLSGLSSWQSYLQTNPFPSWHRPYTETVSHVNHHVPHHSKVLMIFEARGFYFEMPVIQDNLLTNWPLLAQRASELDCLQPAGVSHVLVNTGALTYFLHRGLDPQVAQWETFQHFAEQCLELIYQNNTYVLYRVRE